MAPRSIPPNQVHVLPTVPTEQIRLVGPIPTGWIPVASTWVHSFRYHPATASFDMRTRDGKTYPAYPGCSPEMFRELLAAPSKGSWMAAHYPRRKR